MKISFNSAKIAFCAVCIATVAAQVQAQTAAQAPLPRASQFYDFAGNGNKGFVVGKTIGDWGNERVQIDLYGSISQGFAWQNTLGAFLYKSGIWQGNDLFSLVLEDVNRDGKIDIGLTHGVPNQNADTLLLSQPDGSYRALTGGLIANGDLNMDGRIDLLENPDGQSGKSSAIVKYLNGQSANGAFARSFLQVMTYDEYLASQNQADYEAYLAAMQANKRPPRPNFSGLSMPDENAPDLTNTKPTQVMDMNGDDVPDLVIEGSGLVFYGTENPNRYVIGAVGNNVEARDLNGDGFTDFVVWDDAAQQLKTLVYRGEGNYQTSVLMQDIPADKNIYCYDLDKDGDIDVLATFSYPYNLVGSFTLVALNDGNGNFTINEDGSTTAHLVYLGCADINGDGFYDLLAIESDDIINDGLSEGEAIPVKVQYGQANGTFAAAQSLYTAHAYDDNDDNMNHVWSADASQYLGDMSLHAADIDNDGKAEVWLEGDRSLFHVENGTANTAPTVPTAPSVQFDGATGRLEISWEAAADAQSSACDLTYALRIGTAPGAGDVVFAHANADGSRRNFSDGNAGNNLRKVFDVRLWQPAAYYISVQAIDPQHSGSAFSAETVFENTFLSSSFTVDKTSLAFCDHLTVFYNPMPAGYTLHWELDGAVQLPSSVAGELHLQWHTGGTKTVSLQIETPDGMMSATSTARIDILSNKITSTETDIETDAVKRNGIYNAWLADWDMNGSLDALFQPFSIDDNEYAGLYKNDGAGNFTKLGKLFNLTFAPTYAKWLDWDRDGDVDMFFGNRDKYGEFTYGVLINNGNDNFTRNDLSLQLPGEYYCSGGWQELLYNMADLDNDGYLDVISPLCNNNDHGNEWYVDNLLKNNGNGHFQHIDLPEGRVAFEGLWNTADFNRDGFLDYFHLLSTNSGNNYTYTGIKLLENRGGFTFEVRDIPFDTPISGINRGFNGQPVFADMDNDGYIDMAYCAGEKRVQILYNERNERFVQGESVVMAENISILSNVYGQIFNPKSIGDRDNNGYLDLLLQVNVSKQHSAHYILYNDGNGNYRQGFLSELKKDLDMLNDPWSMTPFDYMGEIIADINGDAIPDMYLGSEFAGQKHDENDYWNTADYYNVFDNHVTVAANTPPQAPTGLIATQAADGLLIEWDAAADNETPAMQMRYNISVKKAGQTGAESYIISPLNAGNAMTAALPSHGNGVYLPPPNYDQEGISKRHFFTSAARFEIPASALPTGDVEISIQAIDLWDAVSPFSAVLTKTIEANPSFAMPATACFGEPTEITYTGTQGGGSPQWDFDGGTVVSGSGFGPYQVSWNSEGVKTISLTADGSVKTSQIKVLPEVSAAFTLADNVFLHTETEIGLPVVPDGSTFTWTLSNNSSIFLEHNISARAGNTKGMLKIIGGCICYRELTLTVTTPNGCSKSFTKGFNVVPAIGPPQIALVYPNGANKNVVAWEQSYLPANTVQVIVYKEGAALNDFYEIGRVAAEAGEFTDLSSNSATHSGRYAISALLSQGMESPKSETHQTLHLTINRGVSDGTWNLIWNAYQGRDIATYRVLYGATPDNLTLLQELSGVNRSFTHTDNPSAPYYAVEYVPANVSYASADRPAWHAPANLPAGRSNVVYSGHANNATYVTSISIQTLAVQPVLSETQPYIYLYTESFPSNATCQNVVWEIAAGSEFAFINGNGKLQAAGNAQAGTVTVRATAADGSGVTAERTFDTQAFSQTVAVTGVTLDITQQSLLIGGQFVLTAAIQPSHAANQHVTWATGNPAVASVSNGLVSALGVGTAIITVTTEDGGFTAQCTVTVEDGAGTDEIGLLHFGIYPNPAKEEIFITSELPVKKAAVYSLTASLLVSEENFNGKISVAGLPTGCYLVKIYTDSGVAVKKIVKE
jgi:hypothetical protein